MTHVQFITSLCLVPLLPVGVWLICTCVGTSDNSQAQITEHEAEATKWRTRYKRLQRTKIKIVPIPVHINSGDCRDALEACEGSLTGIKLWCDPHSKQQLGECLEALQRAQELNRSCYTWNM